VARAPDLAHAALAVYWLPGARGWPWVIAAVVSLLVWFGVLLCVSEDGLGRFAHRSPETLFMATAAVCVLLIRILPAEPPGARHQCTTGARPSARVRQPGDDGPASAVEARHYCGDQRIAWYEFPITVFPTTTPASLIA
jgi:hypothetical protein